MNKEEMLYLAQSANWKGKGNSEEKKGIKSTTSL